ncbi:MAG: SPOR domain-containing protein, partial [Pusillimonas sp.]
MARTRRKSSNAKSGGSTLFGILIGLIFGLVAAVAVALFVTQVPMPFVDKASRDPAQTLLPDVRNAPDPNIGLYGKDSAAGSPLTGPTATAPSP